MKHKARYYLPGILMSETTTRDLERRSTDDAMAVAPEGAFCFVLYDVEEPPDGIDTTKFTVTPKPLNESKRYYIGGEVYDFAGVLALHRANGGTVEPSEYGDIYRGSDFDILLANMRGNDYQRVVHTPMGNWQPLEEGDEVLSKLRAVR